MARRAGEKIQAKMILFSDFLHKHSFCYSMNYLFFPNKVANIVATQILLKENMFVLISTSYSVQPMLKILLPANIVCRFNGGD